LIATVGPESLFLSARVARTNNMSDRPPLCDEICEFKPRSLLATSATLLLWGRGACCGKQDGVERWTRCGRRLVQTGSVALTQLALRPVFEPSAARHPAPGGKRRGAV